MFQKLILFYEHTRLCLVKKMLLTAFVSFWIERSKPNELQFVR